MVQPNVPVKQLLTKWTVELQMDTDPSHDDKLEEELSKILQEEIDWEILTDILNKTAGWVRVDLGNNKAYPGEVYLWLNENCKGQYKNRGGTFLFEDPKDAEWFILKWV